MSVIKYKDPATGTWLPVGYSGGGGSSYTDEQVRDVVAAFIQAGSNVTVTHDDAADTFTIDAAGSSSAASGVFPFTYNTSTAEAITGNQLRGNTFPLTGATKLWVSETTTDGLNVALGMGRIKVGWQQYVQDFSDSTKFCVFNVTTDAVDKGAYWEIGVSLASSGGSLGAGKVAYQSLSPAQANKLFSTTTTAAGLAPGANGVGSGYFLNGAAAWSAGVTNVQGVAGIWTGTQAAYDAIGTKSSTTLYIIV